MRDILNLGIYLSQYPDDVDIIDDLLDDMDKLRAACSWSKASKSVEVPAWLGMPVAQYKQWLKTCYRSPADFMRSVYDESPWAALRLDNAGQGHQAYHAALDRMKKNGKIDDFFPKQKEITDGVSGYLPSIVGEVR
ncbi:hypothetical protein F5Y07DRAFT_395276 [Xylaria sp. FL0933]|nr:hypothetical protein F5Y07DRAFT_395276 [Xylaria sp. FL0933]